MAPEAGPVTPAPASTVLLLREAGGRLEVFLTRRAAGLTFMGGLWVYPGGRVEAADGSSAIAAHVDPQALEGPALRMNDRHGAPLAEADALALCVAACRETFEEAGVLLARRRDSNGSSASLDAATVANDPPSFTRTVTADDFLALLQRENLQLELGRLVHWAHWITPSAEKKRFDTHFFAVQVPEHQVASADLSELTHHAWLGEAEVDAHVASGEMRMAPPTISTLQDLWERHRQHGGLARMLEAERGRDAPAILPKLRRGDDWIEIVMPWDTEYEALPGEACTATRAWPAYLKGQPSRRRLPLR